MQVNLQKLHYFHQNAVFDVLDEHWFIGWDGMRIRCMVYYYIVRLLDSKETEHLNRHVGHYIYNINYYFVMIQFKKNLVCD